MAPVPSCTPSPHLPSPPPPPDCGGSKKENPQGASRQGRRRILGEKSPRAARYREELPWGGGAVQGGLVGAASCRGSA
jgi:hypothetical protein